MVSRNSPFEDLVSRFPSLRPLEEEFLAALRLVTTCFDQGGKLLVCGNGGSAADADHLVGELMKGFLLHRPLSSELRGKLEESAGEDGAFLAETLQGALPAISLSAHAALLSAFSNDKDPSAAYAQQVLGYGRPTDVLVCFSTSGNSRNILLAAKTARALGLRVIGFTGFHGGHLAPLCDAALCVPEEETYKVQELHLPVYHALAAAVEAEFFGA
jgi:D-sedoheptulose 7-phosphate isomerase